ncbi:phage baseplate protein [Citrobacter arsenatis]|uniref:phage baseplate protein n=1 Tax=Citrobacter arsenatis TaxID=2546350 RepID=UPI00300E435F
MILGFGNNVVSNLASDITSTQTSITLMPDTGSSFAALLTADMSNVSTNHGIYAKITITDSEESVFEICHLTAVSGDTLTVVRGQENTTAKSWSLNDVVANFATRGSENAFVQVEQLQAGDYTAGTAAGSENALTLALPTTFFNNSATGWEFKALISVMPSLTNTGPATLQLTMGGMVLGAFPLYKGNFAELDAGDIIAGTPLICAFNSTKSFIQIFNPGTIFSSYLQISKNLAEIAAEGGESQSDARKNLGLGDAATKNVGTTAGTVAAGDDARFGTGLTWDDIYPVGSEYSSYTDNRNPVDIIGIGAWSPVVGLIAGVGAATDSQGLTANYIAGYQAGWWRPQNGHIVAQNLGVTLTMNPVDDHVHGVPVTHIETSNQTYTSISNGSYDAVGGYPTSQPSGGHTPTGTGTVTIGSGAAAEGVAFFNPYYGKYIWVRTA